MSLSDSNFYYRLITKYVNSAIPQVISKLFVTELVGCLRQSYFRRVKPSKIEGPLAVKTFFGQALHQYLEELILNELKETRAEARTEFRIPLKSGEEIVVSGRADLLVVGDREIIIEVKTCDYVPPKPKPHHERQVKYYLALFGLEEGVLLYFDRGGQIRAFPIRCDSKIKREIVLRAKELYYALKHRKPPKAEKGPWCNYCPYKWKCVS